MKPGLWVAAVSQMGVLARRCLAAAGAGFVLPPVFDTCAHALSLDDEIKARDLYWDVILNYTEPQHAAEVGKNGKTSMKPGLWSHFPATTSVVIIIFINIIIVVILFPGPDATGGCHGCQPMDRRTVGHACATAPSRRRL